MMKVNNKREATTWTYRHYLIREKSQSIILAGRIDTEKMRDPAFMMVLCGVAPFAYKRQDGVYVVPITCLKD